MTKAQLSPHLSRPCQLSTREGEKDTHTPPRASGLRRRSVSGEEAENCWDLISARF